MASLEQKDHQGWLDSITYDYVSNLGVASVNLQQAIKSGGRIDAIAVNELEVIAERILKIAQKAKAHG